MDNILFFEPTIVLPAYQKVHEWLQAHAKNYKNESDNIEDSVESLDKAGAHFDSFNHLHGFKAQKIINYLLKNGKLPNLFIPGVRHFVVDIACGSGAA